jgi:hypothetical protein
MRDFGFSVFEYDPFARSLSPVDRKRSDNSNCIFIRGAERIAEVLKNAPKIQIGQQWI